MGPLKRDLGFLCAPKDWSQYPLVVSSESQDCKCLKELVQHMSTLSTEVRCLVHKKSFIKREIAEMKIGQLYDACPKAYNTFSKNKILNYSKLLYRIELELYFKLQSKLKKIFQTFNQYIIIAEYN